MAVKPIPEGYHAVTPYMIVDGAAEAIAFYTKVFGATERLRMGDPSGKIMHAEILIGDSVIMIADEVPQRDIRGPKSFGGSPIKIHLYVDDVDAMTRQAIDCGAKVVRPVQDQFYGDRSGMIEDPFGHVWNLATHKEDLSQEEMDERFQALMKQGRPA